jgi:nicotinamide-nucleotide amidase
MRVEVLAVGRELLIGKTVNTNAHWIGGRLARMGTWLSRITTVDDDLREISSSVRESLRRKAEFLVVVGGLGPTPDDMTLEGIAKGLRRRLALNRDALKMVRDHYVEMGRGDLNITPARRKMARLPWGATPLKNIVGTAPGVRLEVGRTVIFALPGVPREMKSIFRDSLEGEIRRRLGRLHTRTVILKLEGIFESTLAPILKKSMKKYPSVYIKSHPKGVEEGVSKIELDVVVVSKWKADSAKISEKIASELKADVAKAGGTVRSTIERN